MAESTLLLRQTFLVLFPFWREPSPARILYQLFYDLQFWGELGRNAWIAGTRVLNTQTHTNIFIMYRVCGCMLLRTPFWHYALTLSSLDLSGEEKRISAIRKDTQPVCLFPNMFQLIKDKRCIIFYCVIRWKRYSKWAEVSRDPPITDPIMVCLC